MRKKSKGRHTSLLTESWRRIRALMNLRVLVPGSRVRLTQSQESSGRLSNCTMSHMVIPPNGWRLHLNLGRILWIAAVLECFATFPSMRLRDRDCEIPVPSPAKSRPIHPPAAQFHFGLAHLYEGIAAITGSTLVNPFRRR